MPARGSLSKTLAGTFAVLAVLTGCTSQPKLTREQSFSATTHSKPFGSDRTSIAKQPSVSSKGPLTSLAESLRREYYERNERIGKVPDFAFIEPKDFETCALCEKLTWIIEEQKYDEEGNYDFKGWTRLFEDDLLEWATVNRLQVTDFSIQRCSSIFKRYVAAEEVRRVRIEEAKRTTIEAQRKERERHEAKQLEEAKSRGRGPGSIAVGDDMEYVKLQWGLPNKVDRMISSSGVDEWWYYGAYYHQAIHFRDGFVSTIHTSQ